MYTLDIETMKQIMLAHKKTGHLYTDLLSGIPGLRKPCQVEIALEAGHITSCSIQSSNGVLLTGEKAYQELTRLGQLRWTFVSRSPPVARQGPVTRTLTKKSPSHPRRIGTVESWQMQSWPRSHRLVYGLADGTKSVTEIAVLLSLSPEMVEGISYDLHSIGVIIME